MKHLLGMMLSVSLGMCIGCTSAIERGDAARARDDWDAAVGAYEEAVRATNDPAAIAVIKARLLEAREHAADLHLALATQSSALHDDRAALGHLERAYQLRPSEDVRARLQQSQAVEGSASLRDGRLALEQERFSEAVELLARAATLAPSDEASELLAKARTADALARTVEYDLRVAAARRFLSTRDWGGATAEFERARQAQDRPDADREASFAKSMADGEAAAARGDQRSFDRACECFKQARQHELDTSYVDARIAATEIVDLVITIQGAVILPAKPVSGKPWDGLGGGADVSKFGKELALLATTNPLVTSAASLLSGAVSRGSAAPDCFVVVEVDGHMFGGEGTFDQDDFLPHWGLRFTLPYTAASDGRLVTVTIRDRDLEDHDNVGTAHLSVAELVRRAELGHLRFFDETGTLLAGGIVELDVSVERKPAGSGR